MSAGQEPQKNLSKTWLIQLVVVLVYITIGLIFFRIQDWEQCLSKFTGNACTMGQMMPVVLLTVGLIGLAILLAIEPMWKVQPRKSSQTGNLIERPCDNTRESAKMSLTARASSL